MKVKLLKILNSFQALRNLNAQPVSANVAYKNAKNMQLLQNEADAYGNAVESFKNKNKEKLDKKDEEIVQKLQEFCNDLHEKEINVKLQQLTLDEIKDCKISTQDMMNLEFLIK